MWGFCVCVCVLLKANTLQPLPTYPRLKQLKKHTQQHRQSLFFIKEKHSFIATEWSSQNGGEKAKKMQKRVTSYGTLGISFPLAPCNQSYGSKY